VPKGTMPRAFGPVSDIFPISLKIDAQPALLLSVRTVQASVFFQQSQQNTLRRSILPFANRVNEEPSRCWKLHRDE
jgi:hypothetical protein